MAENLWETHAEWWIDGFTAGADPEYEEQILPLAARELAGARQVLDVGCGDGQVSRLAASLGAEVVGIDPTWNCVSVAHQRGRASFARAGAGALPFADGAFDAVVACLVFEHIRDVDQAIAEVARVLQPGGRFCFFLNHPLLQTPNSGWIDDQFLEAIQTTKDIGILCKAAQRVGDRVFVHRCQYGDIPHSICCSVRVLRVDFVDSSTALVRFTDPRPLSLTPPLTPMPGQNFYVVA